jgi:DNA-binding transcriptional LysR family regulator
MLQFQQIRCFVTLAGTLHFGRAAERLNMTQPPFSRQIRLLEEAMGQPLFHRDPRGVRLTELGARFLPEAEYLVRCSDHAVLAAKSAFKGQSGRVALGYDMGVSFGLLPEIVASAAERLPGVQLELLETATDSHREALRTGRADLVLSHLAAPSADLGATLVLRERFWAAVPTGHRLAVTDRIDPKELHGESVFMYQPGRADGLHAVLDGWLQEQGIAPRYVQHLRHGHAMLPLVDAGLGLALVPASLRRMRYQGVAWQAIDLPERVTAETHMGWRVRDDRDNPVVTEMRRLVLEAAAVTAMHSVLGSPALPG